jgi:hypothetical protein
MDFLVTCGAASGASRGCLCDLPFFAQTTREEWGYPLCATMRAILRLKQKSRIKQIKTLNQTIVEPHTEEWIKTLCAVIQKDLAAIDDVSRCNSDKEDELLRKFVGRGSGQTRAKFEISLSVSRRRRELAVKKVSQIMHGSLDEIFIPAGDVREVSIDTAVDMAMTGFMCDQEDGRILNSNASQKLEEIDKLNERIETLVRLVGHDKEITEIQAKIDALKAELVGIGVMVKERTALVSILADFLDEFNAVGRDWPPVFEEHELLKPVARYIYERSVHNSFTTKFLLVQMIDIISRPSFEYVKKCEKLVLFGPSQTLFVSALCFLGVFNAKLEGFLSNALLLACLLFFGWSILRFLNYTRARMIRSRVNALIENFKSIMEPITCDGEELIVVLHKIQHLGLQMPSLIYSLMRLLVPGADGLYVNDKIRG